MTAAWPPALIAVDAMGGDTAPETIVAGALAAALEHDVGVVLVGRTAAVSAALEQAGAPGALPVVEAPEQIGMDEDPIPAVRGKRRASIRVAAELVARGRARALLSAGSTGATLAAAMLVLGRLPAVRRPVVAAVLPVPRPGPGRAGYVVLVDAGGSADARAETLQVHARMGVAYAQVRGVPAPTVGLLNVGVEPGKGNARTRRAYAKLGGTPGFTGSVEPEAVLRGEVDVVVTDGFTGNIFLKTVEATWNLAEATSRQTSGAAVLLGVAGEVLIAHGAADAQTITAALRTAREVVSVGVWQRLRQRLAMA